MGLIENMKQALSRFLETEKGQLSIGSLIMVLIVIILFSALAPTLNYFVNFAVITFGAGTPTSTIIQLWPLGMALAILWGIFIYAKPYYEQYQG